jgi:hypothetical protein
MHAVGKIKNQRDKDDDNNKCRHYRVSARE